VLRATRYNFFCVCSCSVVHFLGRALFGEERLLGLREAELLTSSNMASFLTNRMTFRLTDSSTEGKGRRTSRDSTEGKMAIGCLNRCLNRCLNQVRLGKEGGLHATPPKGKWREKGKRGKGKMDFASSEVAGIGKRQSSRFELTGQSRFVHLHAHVSDRLKRLSF